ncbi:hypothetical protein EYF80_059689 [Liparis tanakae]|uniref:Uncharacterized protein n=1 Tax=Liparis tanakae TaxID=230148 RepID=A0A4Z2ENI7_9TELE|nr:hypothetical protein EYF80_059689 [Liparis tanakae]
MGLYLKITVGLLLLVQALQPASAQSSTDSPGRTIDKSWLRKMPVGSQTADEAEEEDLRPEGAASGNGDGTASGFMAVESEEESNVAVQDQLPDETSEDPTVVTGSPTLPSTPQTDQTNATVSSDVAAMTVPGDSSQIDGTEAEEGLENSKSLIAVTTFPSTVQTDQPNATMSPNTTATTGPATSSGASGTEAEEGLQNFTATTSQIPTTHPSEGNSTGFPDTANGTDVQTTTVSPGTNETQAPNATESSDATTATTTPGATPTMMPTTTSTATTTSGPTTTASGAPPIAPEMSSRTDAGAAEGSSSDKDGFSGIIRPAAHTVWCT